MTSLSDVFLWFSGGERQYRLLFHCMRQDWFWIVATVALDVIVATGYSLIALHWWKNERLVADSPAKRALGSMKNIFVFCGICGYLFIPIKMVWPAWRLYDLVMIGLAYYTWKYALRAGALRVIYQEIDRSERLAQELADSRADARRKTFFLNAISHDLRTPLNGLMLQADVAELSLDAGDAASVRESLAEIKSSARAAADLLNNFLELGRLDWSDDSNHPSLFDLAGLLEHLRSNVQAMADQKGLALQIDVPPGLALYTDRLKLERVLQNLITNGIKFTAEGRVQVLARASGRDLTLHVIDTGIGIASEDQGQLFEEFFQVRNDERNRAKGFGLGLTIARRLAQQLGGDLSLESAPGRGSRFSVHLANVLVPQREPFEHVSASALARPAAAAPRG